MDVGEVLGETVAVGGGKRDIKTRTKKLTVRELEKQFPRDRNMCGGYGQLIQILLTNKRIAWIASHEREFMLSAVFFIVGKL